MMIHGTTHASGSASAAGADSHALAAAFETELSRRGAMPSKPATTASTASVGTNPNLLSGHGSWDGKSFTSVPAGTTVITGSPPHGTILDSLGNHMETNQPMGSTFTGKFAAGSTMPNYTLSPPVGLNIDHTHRPTTVSADTPISSLLRPNMGEVRWAACTFTQTKPAAEAAEMGLGTFNVGQGVKPVV